MLNRKMTPQHTSFPKAVLVALLGVTTVGVFLITATFSTTPEEKALYLQLTEQGGLETTARKNGYQQRSDIQKDLLLAREGQRLQMRLKSSTGALALIHQDHKNVLVEEMQNVDCLLQEKLFEQKGLPMQQLQQILAAKATYYYGDQKLIAENVQLAQYEIPGHAFTTELASYTPSLQGKATQVETTLSDRPPQMKLRGFSGIVSQKP